MGNKIDLTPAVLDLILYSGDGEYFQVSFIDDTNQPIDVSALTWSAQIRQSRSSDTHADLEINTDNAASGIITIHISSEITSSIIEMSQWDLQSTSISRPEPLTVLQGSVSCIRDVTR